MTSLRVCKRIAPVLCALAVLALGVAPSSAAGDADPASDVLLYANVFYPYAPPVPMAIQRTLNHEVARAHRAGFPIKVAIIGRRIDLGGIPVLFGQPERYVKFLDAEISFHALEPVLVIMAAGAAGDGLGKAGTATLATLPPPPSDQPTALAQTAINDVAKLAAATGHSIGPPPSTTSTDSGDGPSAPLIIGTAAIALIATAITLLTARDRRRARP